MADHINAVGLQEGELDKTNYVQQLSQLLSCGRRGTYLERRGYSMFGLGALVSFCTEIKVSDKMLRTTSASLLSIYKVEFDNWLQTPKRALSQGYITATQLQR
jgi:hypothetical protein